MPRPASLSPELLQTFIAVVGHDGDAVAAANALGINQPSMSKRLAQLQHAGRVLRRELAHGLPAKERAPRANADLALGY